MTKIMPHLSVENGRKAIELYEDLFGAQLVRHEKFTPEIGQRFGFPDDFDYEASTLHAWLDIQGGTLSLADRTGPAHEGSDIEIVIEVDSLEEIQAIFDKAKEKGCEFKIELQQMFWGGWFTRFADQFGIGWQISFPLGQSDEAQE